MSRLDWPVLPTTNSELGPTRALTTWLRASAQQLEDHGVPSPRADAEVLAASVLDLDRGELLRRVALGEHLPAGREAAYQDLIDERSRRLPLQHLTGYADFAGMRLRVGPGVFVPRFETEVMVEKVAVVLLTSDAATPVVVDLCTGSAAIALALKQRVPGARVYGVELDPAAHAWAMLNKEQTGLDVEIHLADARTALPQLDGIVDLVTCNPPYVPLGAVPLDPEVRDHDPHLALYGGSADGLGLPRQMAHRATALLSAGGLLAMEHSETQGQELLAELSGSGLWSRVWDEPDLTGRPRTTYAVRAESRSEAAEDEDQQGDDQ